MENGLHAAPLGSGVRCAIQTVSVDSDRMDKIETRYNLGRPSLRVRDSGVIEVGEVTPWRGSTEKYSRGAVQRNSVRLAWHGIQECYAPCKYRVPRPGPQPSRGHSFMGEFQSMR